MKKILKILLFLILGIIVIVVVIGLVINAKGIPTYEVKKIDFTAEVTPAKVERGKKLASMLCAACHLNSKTGTLSGAKMDDAPEFGKLYSQNITQDKEFGIGNWTDGELLFLLRTGILPSGRYAPPYMAKLPFMADEDISSVIAFLKSNHKLVQATHVADQPCEPSFLTKMLCNIAFKPLPFPENPIPMPDTTNAVEWGKYLTLNLDCWTCHSSAFEALRYDNPELTPGYMGGGNQSLKNLEGQQVLSLNLTPDKETGIGNWTKTEFVKALKYGMVPNQEALRYPMVPYSELTDNEAAAIFEYLQTIPAIQNKVERNLTQ